MAKTPIWKLKAWRTEQGLTQAEAGERVGVTRFCWMAWECGRKMPRYAEMIAIYVLTDGEVTPNDFYALPLLSRHKDAA